VLQQVSYAERLTFDDQVTALLQAAALVHATHTCWWAIGLSGRWRAVNFRMLARLNPPVAAAIAAYTFDLEEPPVSDLLTLIPAAQQRTGERACGELIRARAELAHKIQQFIADFKDRLLWRFGPDIVEAMQPTFEAAERLPVWVRAVFRVGEKTFELSEMSSTVDRWRLVRVDDELDERLGPIREFSVDTASASAPLNADNLLMALAYLLDAPPLGHPLAN